MMKRTGPALLCALALCLLFLGPALAGPAGDPLPEGEHALRGQDGMYYFDGSARVSAADWLTPACPEAQPA